MNKRKWMKYNENILRSHPNSNSQSQDESEKFVKYTKERQRELGRELDKTDGNDPRKTLTLIARTIDTQAQYEGVILSIMDMINIKDVSHERRLKAVKVTLGKLIKDVIAKNNSAYNKFID